MVGQELRTAVDRLRLVGLRPYRVEHPSPWGVLLDGVRGEIGLSVSRRWKLYVCIHPLPAKGVASGRDLQKVLGHLCFALLLRRDLLSRMRGAQRGEARPHVGAGSSQGLPDCSASVAPRLACMSVVAVGERDLGVTVAGKIGRDTERWCMRQRLGQHQRRHALLKVGLWAEEHCTEYVQRLRPRIRGCPSQFAV